MVLSRGLVISLGVSALGCTLLFLYFRNKISAVEKKVDVMFDLIQNHQQQQQQMNMQETMQMNSQEEFEVTDNMQSQQETGAWRDEVNSQPDLIQVSDDEEDEDNDSEEVSDSDSDDEEEEEEEEIPKLSLAKTEDMTLEVNDVKKIIVQESKPESNNTELEEPEDVTDSLDEIEVDEDDDDEEDDEDEEEEEDDVKEDVTVEKLDDEFDYNKLKVSELKAIAKQKGLEGYKSLKKGPLVELLKSNE